MNILIVTPFPLNATGGVSSAVLMWYKEFEKHGHNVSVFRAGPTNDIHGVDDLKGFSVHAAYLRSPYIESNKLRAVLSFCLFFPITLRRLHRFLVRNNIDLVTIQYPLPWMFYFSILRKLGIIKLVVTYQGSDAHDLKNWSPIEQHLVRYLLSSADRIIGVSNTLLHIVRSVFPTLRGTYVIIPNGAPVEEISEASDVLQAKVPENYIVTAGHLISRKGIDILINAIAILSQKGSQVHVVCVGDGPEREDFMKLAVEKGVKETFHFVGDQSHAQTIAAIKASLFFVLASRKEGLPLVIAEAMACKKAVIATSVDGIPEIVLDNTTGLLVPPSDPEALAKAILRLYVDHNTRQEFAEHAYSRVLNYFSWKAIATKHLDIYSELIFHRKV